MGGELPPKRTTINLGGTIQAIRGGIISGFFCGGKATRARSKAGFFFVT